MVISARLFSNLNIHWVRHIIGPREFLPDRLPHNGDLDDGYAGTIVFPMGLAEAHARFPQFQQWLTPISARLALGST